MRWLIQIEWNGRRVTVATYRSKDEAEWAAAKWRQEHDCRGDPFYFAPEDESEDVELFPPELGDPVG